MALVVVRSEISRLLHHTDRLIDDLSLFKSMHVLGKDQETHVTHAVGSLERAAQELIRARDPGVESRMNEALLSDPIRHCLANAGRPLPAYEVIARLQGPAYRLGRVPGRLIWRCLNSMADQGALTRNGITFELRRETP